MVDVKPQEASASEGSIITNFKPPKQARIN
jgi:hypothetical protein